MNDILELAKLKRNPFSLVPGEKVKVWAGYQDFREKLLNIVTSCRSDKVGLSEFVVLHGEYGTGKSHAMRYLRNYIEDEKKAEFQSQVVYLESLKLASQVNFLVLYKKIIELLLEEHMIETAEWLDQIIEQNCPSPGALRVADQVTQNEMKYHDRKITPQFPSLPLLLKGIKENDENAKKILMGSNEKDSVLKKFDMISPITNEFSAIRCLGTYINLCTSGPQGFEGKTIPGRNKAFYLFLDEVEMLSDFRPADVVSINQGIRDLVNACPENTCLFLGVTGELRIIPALFEGSVMKRMTREPIEIPPMDNEQAVIFLKEVLKNARRDPNDQDEYPFKGEALMKIAEMTNEKTARELFRNCRRVLENSGLENRLKPNGWIEGKDVEDLIS